MLKIYKSTAVVLFCFIQIFMIATEIDAYPWIDKNNSFYGVDCGIRSLAIDPVATSTIYAGTYGGVFKSTDSGTSWSAVYSGLADNTYINCLAIDPVATGTIYAGSSGLGVYKSTDSGASWSAVNSGLADTNIYCLSIDPAATGTIYAGTSGGVFKSTDSGSSWTAVNSGLVNTNIRSLAIDPSATNTIYAGTYGDGVFKSMDSGASWSAVNSGMAGTNIYCLAIDPSTTSTIYAVAYGDGVFKSMDSGTSWSAINSGLPVAFIISLAMDPSATSTLYVASVSGMFKSNDGGAGWSSVNSGLTAQIGRCIAIDPTATSTIYVGTLGNGVSKSTNGGSGWSAVNTGLINTIVNSLAIDPSATSTIYTGTSGSGIFKSMDSGGIWSVVNYGLTDFSIRCLAINPSATSTIYAGTDGGGVFKSTDSGSNWSVVNSGLTNTDIRCLAIDPSATSTIYAGTDGGGVFKSTDSGGSWSAVNSGLTNTHIRCLAIDPSATGIIYAGTDGGGVFRGTNSGGSWSPVNSGLTTTYIRCLAIDPVDPSIIYAGTNGGVFKSSNYGFSWSTVNSGLTDMDISSLVIDPSSTGTIYAGSATGCVYKGFGGGAGWAAVNSGLTNAPVKCLAIDPISTGTMYAGTDGRGIWKADNPDNPPSVADAISDVSVNKNASSFIIDLSSVFTDIDDDDAAITKSVQSNSDTALVSAGISGNTLTLLFQSDQTGSATIVIRGTSHGLSVDDSFNVYVGDSPPVVSAPILDFTIYEDAPDSTINLTDVFTDPDSDDAAITKTVQSNSNNTLLKALIDGNILTLDYQADQSGSATIVIRGTSNGKSVDDTFIVTVNPVDDAPIVAAPVSDVTVNENAPDSTIDLTRVFSDIDNDYTAITRSVYSNSNSVLVNASIRGNILTLHYVAGQSGTAFIVIRGTSNGKTVDDSITVTVNPDLYKQPVISEDLNNEGRTLSNKNILNGVTVSRGNISGIIINQGILDNVNITEGCEVIGGTLQGVISSNGTLNDVTIADGAAVKGGQVAGEIINYGTLSNVTLKEDVVILNSGTAKDIIMKPGSTINGGIVSGSITGKEGSIINAVIDADLISPDIEIGRGSRVTRRTAINNPGIDLSGVIYSNGIYDPNVPVFNEGEKDLTAGELVEEGLKSALSGFGVEVQGSSETGALLITTSALPGYIVAGVIASIETSDEPDGLKFTPEGNMVVICRGVATTITPAPADVIAVNRAMENMGWTSSCMSNGLMHVNNGSGSICLRFDLLAKIAGSQKEKMSDEVIMAQETDDDLPEYDRIGGVFYTQYADGSRQRMLAFISNFDALEECLSNIGYKISIDPFSGIFTVYSLDMEVSDRGMVIHRVTLKFLPDYVIDGNVHLPGKEKIRFESVGDIDQDGYGDIAMITSSGSQLLYLIGVDEECRTIGDSEE